MKIELVQAGKRFNREWIFRNASLSFQEGTAYAITGHNGSGKSTLLQCICGAIQLSEGKLQADINGQSIKPDEIFAYSAICAPYLELIEEMTLTEFLDFHGKFKPYRESFRIPDIISLLGLQAAAEKQIRYYSSGMKQRVKLAQAIFSNASLLLLDEPCTNLDQQGIDLYHHLISLHKKNRIVIVCSNDPVEYDFCSEILRMQYLKP